ncbi:MAG: hypothetical protein FWC38_09045 [Proteobacteria bacterium]|nr:hypothetical protein [Pseudomonadota bacterium]MCL2308345.1 hypothetical protein [Pseudomonadota bacterium]
MLFDTSDGKTRYAAQQTRDLAGAPAGSVRLAAVSGHEKKQRNFFAAALRFFQAVGLRLLKRSLKEPLKAKPKNRLAVKVTGYSMAPPLFNGNASVINGLGSA